MKKTRSYLSPSAIKLYTQSVEDFYLRYLADHEASYEPQTQAMAIGSSFDAYVKSFLYERLFGKNHNPKYDLVGLFEAQVDERWRTWAWEHGKYVFNEYIRSGALADLMLELQSAVGTPRFEFEIRGVIDGKREGLEKQFPYSAAHGVTLLGKPDVFFINSHGAYITLDFKVNGYCSNYKKYPDQGYIRLRDIGCIYNRRDSGAHKTAMPMTVKGVLVNCADYLENTNSDWAQQLAIYSWLLGCEIGAQDSIYAIDQICCDNTAKVDKPLIAIAEHRARISKTYQEGLFILCCDIWDRIHNEPFHFFREMSLEESNLKCQMLDQKMLALRDNPDFMNCIK